MQVQEQLYSNAIFGRKPGLLKAIYQKEVSIAVYQRNLQSLESDLSIAIEKKVNFQVDGETHKIASLLKVFFTENLPECNALLNDITWVLAQFHVVANASSYRMLLSTVSSNMCRKFHTDINDVRLLCTYVGPGTLWVSEDEKNGIVDEELPINENQVNQAVTGDVLVLKGALHPEGNPIVHRSPLIEETGDKRLLLRIDTNSFLDF